MQPRSRRTLPLAIILLLALAATAYYIVKHQPPESAPLVTSSPNAPLLSRPSPTPSPSPAPETSAASSEQTPVPVARPAAVTPAEIPKEIAGRPVINVYEDVSLDQIPTGHKAINFRTLEGLDSTAELEGVVLNENGLQLDPTFMAGEGPHMGIFTSPPAEPEFLVNAAGPQWKENLPQGTTLQIEFSFSLDQQNWTEWYPVEVDPHSDPAQFYPDGRPNPNFGFTIGTLVIPGTGTERYSYYRYRAILSSEINGASPTLTDLRLTYMDSTGLN